jgi:hypothetical protein
MERSTVSSAGTRKRQNIPRGGEEGVWGKARCVAYDVTVDGVIGRHQESPEHSSDASAHASPGGGGGAHVDEMAAEGAEGGEDVWGNGGVVVDTHLGAGRV